MEVITFAYVLLGVFVSISVAEFDDVTVSTKVGTFIGFSTDVNLDDTNVRISKFLGIPYAEPPVGSLRFQKTVPKERLEEPLVTKKHGPECVQVQLMALEGATSEDCLYLNVYAPKKKDGDENLAVMVWIHGGGFFAGSANQYVSDKLAATGGVIVVTINYRLSALGFLNVGDSVAPGNYGLWDQHLAIKWVHDNIHAFGGDNERITIFGESAGAGSVIYQGIYPGNKNLFQRIIAESGSAAAPWANTNYSLEEAKELATIVGCNTDDIKDMAKCLREAPIGDINSAINDFTGPLMRNPFPFLPSVDNDFVKVLPKDIFNMKLDVASEERSTLASFDLLIGANAAEGATCLSPFCGVMEDPNEFLPNRSFFGNTLVPLCTKYFHGKVAPSVLSELIIAEYTDWADPENPLSIRDQFVAMHGDHNFIAPTHVTVSLHANMSKKDLYVYHFNAKLDKHILPMPSWMTKAVHADELVYVFGGRESFAIWGGSKESFTKLEEELSKNMIIMWSNFAKSGNPNKPRYISIDWQQFTTEKHLYLEITNELRLSKMKERLEEGRANFWNTVLPSVSKSLKSASFYEESCEKDGHCSP